MTESGAELLAASATPNRENGHVGEGTFNPARDECGDRDDGGENLIAREVQGQAVPPRFTRVSLDRSQGTDLERAAGQIIPSSTPQHSKEGAHFLRICHPLRDSECAVGFEHRVFAVVHPLDVTSRRRPNIFCVDSGLAYQIKCCQAKIWCGNFSG